MHICISGPMSLNLINHPFDKNKMPIGYPFPPMAHLVNAFLKRGHKVSVVTYSIGIDKPIVFESGKISFYIAKRREKKAARDFFKIEVEQMVDFFNSIDCDIVFSNWTYEISLAALKSKQKKITIRVHDYPPLIFRFNPDPYRFIRMLIHYYVSNKAYFLNCNSSYTYEKLPQRIRKKAVVIPNFFSDELSQRISSGKEDYIITVSQGFKGHKNISKGILAFNKIHKLFPNLEYYLVGDQLGEKQEAYYFAKKYGVDKGIRFLGRKPYSEVLDLISHAKILLHPSLEESFGMSVLEAMVLGTPVVGGNKSGNIPYLLGGGQYGVTCDVSNYFDIYNKITELLGNENLLNELAAKARTFAINNFSESVVIENFEKYFENIIND